MIFKSAAKSFIFSSATLVGKALFRLYPLQGFARMVLLIGRLREDNVVELLGTGFMCSPGHVVTAAHVVGDNDSGLCLFNPMVDVGGYQDTTKREGKYTKVRIKEIDPFRDLAILEAPINLAGRPSLGTLDQTKVGDQLLIVGYPHATDGRKVLTLQSGIVGAKVLLGAHGLKAKHAIVNLQARPGQSGSLVFSQRQRAIVGVLIGAYVPSKEGSIIGGINPAELHQTTHCISAEYVRQMI